MFDKLIEKLTYLNLKWSKWIIAGTIIVTLVFSFFMKNLYFDNDLTNWMDESSEIGKLIHYTSEKFGSTTPILLELEFEDCFTKENLTLIKNISDFIEKIDGVESVLSIANIEDVSSSEGSLKSSSLIEFPLPENKEYYADLKKYVLSKRSYNKSIVSSDATTVMMIAKPMIDRRSDVVASAIKREVQAFNADKNVRIYYGGLPSFMTQVTGIVLQDFIILIPLVILVVVGVLLYSFRTLRGILLPLLSVASATLLTMGLMGLFRMPLNIMSVTIPVVLIACGNAYGIHVLNRYYEKAVLFRDKKEIIVQVMKEISLPVILSGLTAAFGFFSLATAQVSLVKDFGIFTGIGVVFATFISLMFIPSILNIAKIRKSFRMQSGSESIVKAGKVAVFFTNLVSKRSIPIIIGFAIVTVAGIISATKLESKIDYLSYFDAKSEPRIVSDLTIKKFGGYFPYDIYMKADIANPDILKTLLVTEERMKAYTRSNPNGIAGTVAMLNHAMSGVKTIPETKEEVENLWFFVEGKSELDGMVTKERDEALVSCMIDSTDPEFINGLGTYIDEYIARFGRNITTIANVPGNPEITNVEKVFIGNLLTENGVSYDEKSLDALVARLVSEDRDFSAKPDGTALVAYLSGDESEIPFDKDEAVKIASAVSGLREFDTGSIMNALTKASPGASDYDEADREALARSLSGIITEGSIKGRLDNLTSLLKTAYPQTALASEENLNYSLAPFTWKTIPAISEDTSAIVNRTGIERVEHTGYAYIAEQLRREILRDQVISLAITLIAVLLFNGLVFRSLKQGLISMVAMPFTLVINYGLMALLKIPLDIATVTVGSISIIGIDYTLHYIARYSIEIKKAENDKHRATLLTFATAGKAIIFNALSVGLGFAALCFSNIIAIRNLGFLLAVTMLVSCVTSLVLLPAAMSIGKATAKNVRVASRIGKEIAPEDSV